MNNDDTFHDELTAHLAAQEFPPQHPPRYDHGYPRRDPVMVTTLTGEQFTVEEWAKRNQPRPARKHTGPITMHEPRVDWIGWVLAGGTLLAGVFAAVAWVKGVRP